ncbi:MAG TPA: triose-phosphate isomerase [Rhizomicrobium sp.]|jgi:triosephosphate isomerase|nr:triose-phosphate isomerase [Rhizomicrobium sp.]
MRPLIAGNWKMNGLSASLTELGSLKAWLVEHKPAADVLICPPATLIVQAVHAVKGVFAIGGQNCAADPSGAFTGDISAEMLKDAGASYVIVGHSERRQYHNETDVIVADKARAAWRAGLKAIICIGETEAEREKGHAFSVCQGQLDASVPTNATAETTAIAYEPIWAIGTGRTATRDDIAEMHAHIRASLIRVLGEAGRSINILYGGSVKPSNAAEILRIADVGGALVGGASLKAADFCAIVASAPSKP